MAEEEQHLSTDEARAAETGTGLKGMLIGGLIAIIVLFAIILLVYR